MGHKKLIRVKMGGKIEIVEKIIIKALLMEMPSPLLL